MIYLTNTHQINFTLYIIQYIPKAFLFISQITFLPQLIYDYMLDCNATLF